jgi:hypothetical protein
MSAARIQQSYIARFNRPADPLGLSFWLGQTNQGTNLTPMLATLASTAEYQDRFTGLTPAQQVNSIYQALFGRDADLAGLTFFVNQLQSGAQTLATLAVNILDGALGQSATNTDRLIIENKTTAATNFTTALDTTNEVLAYSGQTGIAAGTAYLNPITSDAATVPTTDATNTAVSNLVTQAPSNNPGQTFTLTDKVDILSGSSGNDKFVGSNADAQVADQIDGGAGEDTLQIFSTGTVALPQLVSIETLYINDTVTDSLDFGSRASVKTVEIDNATTLDGLTEAEYKFGSGQSLILDSVTDGDTAADTAGDEGELDIATGSAEAFALTLDDVGATGAQDDLDLDFSSSSLKTLNVTSSGDTNFVGLFNSGGALETVNVSGTKMFDADEDAVATIKTVDASKATGGVKLNVTGSTADLNFTGSTGNDTFIVGAQLTATDKINGGDGTDTVVVSDSDLTSKSSTVGKGIQALTGIEIVGTNATAGDGIQIKFNEFTINNFQVDTTAPGANAADAAGDVAVAVTGLQNDDTLTIANSITGGTSAAGNSAGGDAINVQMALNSGSDILNLAFTGAATVTGGLGQDEDGGGDAADVGGDALDASTIETINISTASASADVSFVGGRSRDDSAAAFTGPDGSSVKVGANATINITGAGDVNLGTVVAPSTDTDDLTVNGSGMTGVLVVTTGAGNDVITGGSKGDTLNGGQGTNVFTGGAGGDTFGVVAGNAVGAQDRITDFTAGNGNDVLNQVAGGDTKAYDALTSAEQTTVTNAATLADAVNAALADATNGQWTAFTYDSKTYAVYDTNDAFDTTNGILVELTGVNVSDLVSGNFA